MNKEELKTYIVDENCKEATLLMSKQDLSLRRVRGHYYCPLSNKNHAHWWLVDANNVIIDPTRGQFLSNGHGGTYREWDESSKEPTDMCVNCGNYCYNSNAFCSDECSKQNRVIFARCSDALTKIKFITESKKCWKD